MHQPKFAVARHTVANTRDAGAVQSVYGLPPRRLRRLHLVSRRILTKNPAIRPDLEERAAASPKHGKALPHRAGRRR
jgi:hypothetical protein